MNMDFLTHWKEGGGGGGGGDDPWELCKCSIFTPNTNYILLSLGQLMLCQQLCTGVTHHLKWEAPSESVPHFKEAASCLRWAGVIDIILCSQWITADPKLSF